MVTTYFIVVYHRVICAIYTPFCIVTIRNSQPSFPSRGTLSNIRAGQDFGYQGRVDIEEGFKLYHEWLRRTV